MKLTEHADYNKAFPQDRFAHVHVTLIDGTVFKSERHQAVGDPETPLSDDEIRRKYFGLAEPVLGEKRAKDIDCIISGLGFDDDFFALTQVLSNPV